MTKVTCPCCGASFDEKTEQHACIVLFEQCIPCKFTPNGRGSKDGTQANIDEIQAKAKELRT